MSSDVKVSSASLPVHKVQTDLLEPGTGEGPQDSSIGTSCRGQGKIQGLVVSGNMSNEYWSWSVKNFRKNLKIITSPEKSQKIFPSISRAFGRGTPGSPLKTILGSA